MPYTHTATIGTTAYTRSYSNITNAKIKNIFLRSAKFQGIPTEGRTEEQIMLDIIDKDLARHLQMSKQMQKQELEAANQAAIDTALESDNTLG